MYPWYECLKIMRISLFYIMSLMKEVPHIMAWALRLS